MTSTTDGFDDSAFQEFERKFRHLKGVMEKGPSTWEALLSVINSSLLPDLEHNFCKRCGDLGYVPEVRHIYNGACFEGCRNSVNYW